VPVGDHPYALCYNQESKRVYCANVQGSSISVLHAAPGVQETMNDERGTMDVIATIIHGVLVLGAVDSRQHTAYRAELLDITGRRVLDLHHGPNDVRSLAPGVYFVITPSSSSSPPEGEMDGVRGPSAVTVRKIVIE